MSTEENGLEQLERALSDSQGRSSSSAVVQRGITGISASVIENIKNICDEILQAGTSWKSFLDIYQRPDLAARDQVVAAPMLVKRQPLPLRND